MYPQIRRPSTLFYIFTKTKGISGRKKHTLKSFEMPIFIYKHYLYALSLIIIIIISSSTVVFITVVVSYQEYKLNCSLLVHTIPSFNN